jgi:uncharacterized protein (UPF0335 family)
MQYTQDPVVSSEDVFDPPAPPEKSLLDLVREDPHRLDVIREAATEIIQCDAESKTLNHRRQLARDRVSEIGISTAAFKRAVSRYKLDSTDREEQEMSYQICVAALGVEHQMDLVNGVDLPLEH